MEKTNNTLLLPDTQKVRATYLYSIGTPVRITYFRKPFLADSFLEGRPKLEIGKYRHNSNDFDIKIPQNENN